MEELNSKYNSKGYLTILHRQELDQEFKASVTKIIGKWLTPKLNQKYFIKEIPEIRFHQVSCPQEDVIDYRQMSSKELAEVIFDKLKPKDKPKYTYGFEFFSEAFYQEYLLKTYGCHSASVINDQLRLPLNTYIRTFLGIADATIKYSQDGYRLISGELGYSSDERGLIIFDEKYKTTIVALRYFNYQQSKANGEPPKLHVIFPEHAGEDAKEAYLAMVQDWILEENSQFKNTEEINLNPQIVEHYLNCEIEES